MEKYFIPRNIIDVDDTFPFDFIVHIELQKRQIPYILSGVAISVLAVTATGNIIPMQLVTKGIIKAANYENINLLAKGIISILSIGGSYILAGIKKENQHLEQLLNNYILYNIDLFKFKSGRRKLNEKDFKGGIPQFTIKK